jgi:predicted lysophospholipase L1 biosynthesis ABC-type transport system permease subunit
VSATITIEGWASKPPADLYSPESAAAKLACIQLSPGMTPSQTVVVQVSHLRQVCYIHVIYMNFHVIFSADATRKFTLRNMNIFTALKPET